MALSWISRSRKVGDVDSLVARGRYAKAVKALRAEFEGRQPTLAERLRYADLLVLASRSDEALPILLGVADEQARYGFRDKAVEALRRAEEIDPGHPKVRHRLQAFRSGAPSDRPPDPSTSSPAGAPDWGSALDDAFPPGAAPTSASWDTGAIGTPESGSPGGAPASPPEPETASVAEVRDEDDERLVPEDELEPAEDELELEENELEPAEEEPELVLSESELEPEAPPPTLTVVRVGAAVTKPLFAEAEPGQDGAEPPEDDVPSPLDEASFHRFLVTLGRTPGTGPAGLGPALFADFPREAVARVAPGVQRRRFTPGDVLVTEGDPGTSLFLIARGSVRVLVLGGHGQPFDVRRLDAGDFFGELAVLSGWPRTATVVAATPCETLEIGPEALETLLALRPAARKVLEETGASRAQSPEEQAVRSLPPEAADPEHAAEALRAHFGGSEWSYRVRLHLAQLMLDVGRQEEALAILASVAEDLARSGHAQKAITVLKKVEWIRRRGVPDVPVASLRKGRRRSARPRSEAPTRSPVPPPGASTAANSAALREWVGSMLRVTHALAARPASPPTKRKPRAEDHRTRDTV
jgi:tetratricopeptide (TPR) repeat protein